MYKLSEYQIKKISNIATDLIGNKVVFFVGAGFSRDLGYPGWGELLKAIIHENKLMEEIKNSSLFYLMSEQDHPEYEKVNELLLKNLIGVDFLRLAGYVDLLLKENGKNDIKTEIKKQIIRFEERRIDNSKKYKSYREILNKFNDYISEIITTNYDTNIEYCIENVSVIHRNLESINIRSNDNLKRNIKLYKIHGCITDQNNEIIITEKDYQEFNSSNKYIFNKLYSTFMENNIVFIGYSLTDPNIRTLLSEVIDELKRNRLDKKKIYWINKGQINEIDRKFYENIYSIQIIDQIDIIDFLEQLDVLANSKWNDLKKVENEWQEVSEELILKSVSSDINYIDLVNKSLKTTKTEQILSNIYKRFTLNDALRNAADKAFFMLLSRVDAKLITKFEAMVTSILEVEDNHLLTILELLKDDTHIRELFIEKKYSKKLLESLISLSETINDFYLYKRYAIALLDYYEIFDGKLWGLKSNFIDAFLHNYGYLTSTRTLGYSWESLDEVKGKLSTLTNDVIEDIVKKYSDTSNSVQVEQIKALTSHLDGNEKTRMIYEYVMKPRIIEKIERVTIKVLMENLVRGNDFQSDIEKIDDKFADTFRKDSLLLTLTSSGDNHNKTFHIKFGEQVIIITTYAGNYANREFYLKMNNQDILIQVPNDVIEPLTNCIEGKLKEWSLV
ncbi:SIR2 family protein [Priestia aryabhattai]